MTTKDIFDTEVQELRSRRDTEEKLVRLWLAICTGVLSGAFAFAQWVEPTYLLLIFCISAAGLLVGIAVRISDKIEAEHQVYESIGKTIIALLAADFSLGDKSSGKPDIGSDIKNIGQGLGYRKTCELIRFSAGFVALALIILGLAMTIIPKATKNKESNLVPDRSLRTAMLGTCAHVATC